MCENENVDVATSIEIGYGIEIYGRNTCDNYTSLLMYGYEGTWKFDGCIIDFDTLKTHVREVHAFNHYSCIKDINCNEQMITSCDITHITVDNSRLYRFCKEDVYLDCIFESDILEGRDYIRFSNDDIDKEVYFNYISRVRAIPYIKINGEFYGIDNIIKLTDKNDESKTITGRILAISQATPITYNATTVDCYDICLDASIPGNGKVIVIGICESTDSMLDLTEKYGSNEISRHIDGRKYNISHTDIVFKDVIY